MPVLSKLSSDGHDDQFSVAAAAAAEFRIGHQPVLRREGLVCGRRPAYPLISGVNCNSTLTRERT